jgi:protein TonB
MTTAVANADEFALKRFLVYSLSLHGALVVAIAVSTFVHWPRGDQWSGTGNIGDAQKVNLVTSAGIPLPQPKQPTDSKTVDPTMSINKEDLIKPPEPKTDATPIQKFKIEKPQPPSKKSRTLDTPKPPPPNAVPGQSSGAPRLPVGSGDQQGSASQGVAVQAQGGGDFASRYSWYIDAVRRRIQSNWLQNTIDANVLAARTAHTVALFTIMKDGTVKDVRVQQTSGNSSMDNSGLRAILSSNPMPPLPNDYSGSYVSVTFDFDLSLKR